MHSEDARDIGAGAAGGEHGENLGPLMSHEYRRIGCRAAQPADDKGEIMGAPPFRTLSPAR
jgi:hypothetical protein